MAQEKRYVALDFGINRGVVAAGCFDGEKLALERLLRFDVGFTDMLGVSYWDFPAMLINAKRGLFAYSSRYGTELAGIGADSWSGDFGFLDKTGHLLANPVNFMNTEKMGMNQRLYEIFPPRSLFQRTGIQSNREITLFKLFAMAHLNSPLLDKAVTMLMMADLVAYFLTGAPVQEYTLATTTGMYDMDTDDWSRDIIIGGKIPPIMVPEIVAPGTVIGPLLDTVATEVGLGPTPVIAPASHGPAGALAAVPARGDDWLCVTSGFWTQITAELPAAVKNDAIFNAGLSNLGGVDKTVRLQKEILGMGGIQECIRQWWREDGRAMPLTEVLNLADGVQPLQRFVNLADPKLVVVGRRPETVNEILRQTDQPPITTRGEMVRLFLDSMILSQCHAVKQMQDVTRRKYSLLHFVGRGVNFSPLCQGLADATGIPVKAGPTEAKAVGNVLMQMIALGDLGSLADARELVRKSFAVSEFTPKDGGMWEEAYNKYRKML